MGLHLRRGRYRRLPERLEQRVLILHSEVLGLDLGRTAKRCALATQRRGGTYPLAKNLKQLGRHRRPRGVQSPGIGQRHPHIDPRRTHGGA